MRFVRFRSGCRRQGDIRYGSGATEAACRIDRTSAGLSSRVRFERGEAAGCPFEGNGLSEREAVSSVTQLFRLNSTGSSGAVEKRAASGVDGSRVVDTAKPMASGSRAARRLQTRCPEGLMVPTVMVPDRGSRRPGFEPSHGWDRLRVKSSAPEPRGGSRARRVDRHQGTAFSGSWPRKGRQDEAMSSGKGSSRRSPETRMRIGQGCASRTRSAQDPASDAGSRVTSADLRIGRQVSNGPRVVRHARSGDLRGAGREPEATVP